MGLYHIELKCKNCGEVGSFNIPQGRAVKDYTKDWECMTCRVPYHQEDMLRAQLLTATKRAEDAETANQIVAENLAKTVAECNALRAEFQQVPDDIKTAHQELMWLRDQCASLKEQREAAEAKNERLMGLVRKIEWLPQIGAPPVCPACEWEQTLGHAPDCELAKALEG